MCKGPVAGDSMARERAPVWGIPAGVTEFVLKVLVSVLRLISSYAGFLVGR